MSKRIALNVPLELWYRIIDTGLTRRFKDQELVRDAIALYAYMHEKRLVDVPTQDYLEEYYRPESARLDAQKKFDQLILAGNGELKKIIHERLLNETSSYHDLLNFGFTVVKERNEIHFHLTHKNLAKEIKKAKIDFSKVKKFEFFKLSFYDMEVSVRFAS